MSFTVYCTGHKTSAMVCEAFAAGCDARVLNGFQEPVDDGNDVFFYGVLRGNLRLKEECERRKRRYFLCDNGFIRGGHPQYRIARSSFMGLSVNSPSPDRFKGEILPWRSGGGDVIVCVQPPEYGKVWGFDNYHWLKNMRRILGNLLPDKRIVERRHPANDPQCSWYQESLAAQLKDAWALVTYDSTTAIRAAMLGTPVIVTADVPFSRLGSRDIKSIVDPVKPDDRFETLALLASNQWTLDEFKSGAAARAIQ